MCVTASVANKRVGQVRALTLELSGGEAVRLERVVSHQPIFGIDGR
jgi:hypothetical protein